MWRAVRWLMSVFHLVPAVRYADEESGESDDESDDEYVVEEESSDDAPKHSRTIARPIKKRARRASHASTDVGTHAYELPDPAFLVRSNFGKNVITPELKRNAAAMEVHFAEYGVRGKVVGIRPGPIVTLYEFMPDSGVRMVDVRKTVSDMTRAMATENIRIAHIPNTQLIGVEW